MTYKNYLQSKAWKAKRRLVLKHYGKKCLLCRSEKVDIHHLTYKDFGEEKIKQLIPVCRKHHGLIHKFCDDYEIDYYRGTIEFLYINGVLIEKLWTTKAQKKKQAKIRKKKKKPRIPKAIWHGVKRKY